MPAPPIIEGERQCQRTSINPPICPAFERTSKRRKGFPSETRVKRGLRFVRGGQKELVEKLGRNDPCPCGSGKRFQALLHELRPVRRIGAEGLLAVTGDLRGRKAAAGPQFVLSPQSAVILSP